MPQACTLMRTVPARGSGMGRSVSSSGPFGRVTCTTRMFAMVFTPIHTKILMFVVLALRAHEKNFYVLLSAETACNMKRFPGDPARIGRRQKNRGGGDVLRLTNSAE